MLPLFLYHNIIFYDSFSRGCDPENIIGTTCIAKVKGSGIDSIIAALAVKENTVLITNDRKLHDRLRAFESGVDVRMLADMSLAEIKLMSD